MKNLLPDDKSYIYQLTKSYYEFDSLDENLLKVFDKPDSVELTNMLKEHSLYDFFTMGNLRSNGSILNAEKVSKQLYFSIYINELLCISETLIRNHIRHVFIKGVSLSKILFDSFSKRDIGDIDLVVDKENANQVYRILKDIGYFQLDNVVKNEIEPEYSCNFHEANLIKKHRYNRAFNICLELKWGSSALPKDFDLLMDYTQKLKYNGKQITTLDLNATFFHLLANTYVNFEYYYLIAICKMRDYFETAYFIKKYQDEIDWDLIFSLSEKFQNKHRIYDVLNSIEALYGLPQNVLDKWVPKFALNHYINNVNLKNDDVASIPRHKPHPLYRVIDKEFTQYHAYLAHKAWVYSKKHPFHYKKERFLIGEKAKEYQYDKSEAPITFKYFLSIDKNIVKIVFQMDTFEDVSIDLLKNLFIRVLWVDNDIQSCCLYYNFFIPIVNCAKDRVELYYIDTVCSIYNDIGESSKEIMLQEILNTPVKVKRAGEREITIEINSDIWFTYLDTIFFEVGINRIDESKIHKDYNYGIKQHMVEYIE